MRAPERFPAMSTVSSNRIRNAASLAFACLLASCGSTEIRLSRIDGQPMHGNPTLERQFTVDDTTCRDEVAMMPDATLPERRKAAEDVYRGCMAQHGYMAAP